MKSNKSDVYLCPYSKQPLEVVSETPGNTDILSGYLVSTDGSRYPIRDGMPFLLQAEKEVSSLDEKKENEYYEASYESYDLIVNWIFKSFYEDEVEVRNKLVNLLELNPDSRVLETGAGTCQDSMYIAKRLGKGGELFVQDFSPSMLMLGREKMKNLVQQKEISCDLEFFVGNAAYLPFPDGYFDAVYHFGGINFFADKKKAVAEMARVVRVGGKVVFGDESMAPWLRDNDYGKIIMNSSELYRCPVPIDDLPECAREVCLQWFLGNAYYVIDFKVGNGVPSVDLDLPILGKRGGTHRTRFYGDIGSVTLEAKARALKAAESSGLSIHEWLDRMIRESTNEG